EDVMPDAGDVEAIARRLPHGRHQVVCDDDRRSGGEAGEVVRGDRGEVADVGRGERAVFERLGAGVAVDEVSGVVHGVGGGFGRRWEERTPATACADGADDRAEGLPKTPCWCAADPRYPPLCVRTYGVLGRSACSGRSACRHCSRFGSPGPRSSQRTSLSLSLSYETSDVICEHTTEHSDTVRQNRAVALADSSGAQGRT